MVTIIFYSNENIWRYDYVGVHAKVRPQEQENLKDYNQWDVILTIIELGFEASNWHKPMIHRNCLRVDLFLSQKILKGKK